MSELREEAHSGRALVYSTGTAVHIEIQCGTCSGLTVEVPLGHVRSLALMLQDFAQKLGLEGDVSSRIVKSGSGPGAVAAFRAEMEHSNLTRSSWDD